MDINDKRIRLTPIYFYRCDEFNLVPAGKTKEILLNLVDALNSSKGRFKNGDDAIEFFLEILESRYINR